MAVYSDMDGLEPAGPYTPTEGPVEYYRGDMVNRLLDAASEQLAYMDLCNDKGDLERNLRAAVDCLRGNRTSPKRDLRNAF
jgi:hypothetical protein